MKQRSVLRLAAALTALSATSLAGAAEHYDARSVQVAGLPDVAARSFLEMETDGLRLGGIVLERTGTLPTSTGHVVRFEQRHQGLRVFGGMVAVRVDAEGRARSAEVDVARSLPPVVQPALREEDARAVVAGLRGRPATFARVELGVLPDEEDAAVVYRVDVPTMKGGHRYYVDASTGAVVRNHPIGRNVSGLVYPISSAVTPDPTQEDLSDLVTATPQKLNGFGDLFSVYEYGSGSLDYGDLKVTQKVEAMPDGSFDYAPPKDELDEHDAFAAVNAYYHLHRARKFYTDTLGLDMSPIRWSLGAVVNVMDGGGGPMDNAAYGPYALPAPWSKNNTIIIGQGSGSDFAYDSDVFLHEYLHYVAHNAVGYNEGFNVDTYGMNAFPGAIDEGTADYFACTLNGDPVLGEASLATLYATRDLTEGGKVCPDDLFGESHEDGKMIGTLTWAVREAIGAELADKVVWSALAALTKSATLGDMAKGIADGVEALRAAGTIDQAQADLVTAAIAEGHLDDCGRVLSLDEGKNRHVSLMGLSILAQLYGAGTCSELRDYGIAPASMFHFSSKPRADQKQITFKAGLVDKQGKGDISWSIYVRRADHVTFKSSTQGFPVVSKYSYKLENVTDMKAELTIGPDSDPPFDPALTYYAVVVHQNCPMTALEISVSDLDEGSAGAGGSSSEGSSGGSAGTGGKAPTKQPPSTFAGGAAGIAGSVGTSNAALERPTDLEGGCAVSSSPASGGWALPLLGLAALGAFRLRRRARRSLGSSRHKRAPRVETRGSKIATIRGQSPARKRGCIGSPDPCANARTERLGGHRQGSVDSWQAEYRDLDKGVGGAHLSSASRESLPRSPSRR
jgi:MYXO-CTERM domain-containing protein